MESNGTVARAATWACLAKIGTSHATAPYHPPPIGPPISGAPWLASAGSAPPPTGCALGSCTQRALGDSVHFFDWCRVDRLRRGGSAAADRDRGGGAASAAVVRGSRTARLPRPGSYKTAPVHSVASNLRLDFQVSALPYLLTHISLSVLLSV